MTPERWEQITNIYHSALEMESGARRRFLDEACAGDESLRAEVESLLAADAEAGDFIGETALKDAASFLTAKDFISLSGRNLAHYQIVSRLGAGGMGEVYLAKDLKLNRPVAVKTLPVYFSSNPLHLRRFQTEAKAAATLNHPNVATVYSVEQTNGRQFITMEYVEGKTLAALIPENGLNLKTFLEWFGALADALAHAHEKGIVHRDVKPRNIMITPAGTPKMLDFGLAQIAQPEAAGDASTAEITQPGQVLGTPSYMSPEQAEGKELDARSDIFSFGVVMYEALTGARPFKGDSYASMVGELLNKEPLPVDALKPEIPFLLSRLVTRCLNKDRHHRFQSMREVRVILEEVEAALDAGVSANSLANRLLAKPPGFSHVWFFAAAVLTVMIAAFAFYHFIRQNPPPLNFENMTLRKLSQTGNVVYAHVTPDGKSVVYNTIEEDDGRSLWIRRVEDKNALRLAASQPVFFWGGLAVSPDGSQIFYITAGRDARHGTLYRVSSLGGTPRKIAETVNDLGSLSPDGRRVLYVRYGERMQILSADAADGSDERVIQTGESNHIFRDPHFSIDGNRIFFIKFERKSGEEFWSLVEIPATGGAERIIVPSRKPRISEIVVLKDGGLLVNATDPASNLQQIYRVSPSDGAQQRVTNDLNTYFGISTDDDGKTIVTAQRHTTRDLWVVPDGEPEQARKITTESSVYSSGVWTPDGRIVYDALDNNRPHVWITNADGSNPQQLTPNDSSDFEPRVSPDGRYIVFTSERSGERKVWRMNIDGSSPQLLTPGVGTATSPIFTPDGQTVLFWWNKENKAILGAVSPNGGEITEKPLFSANLFSISPDGRRVAHSFYDEHERRYKTRVRPIDGDESSVIFDISPISFLIWAADGKGLLYREIGISRESSSTVWRQPITGGAPKLFLTVKPDSVFNISQSKDGKQTAVVRGKLSTDAVILTVKRPN